MNEFQYRNPTPPWVQVNQFDTYLDTSVNKYTGLYPEEMMDTVKYFQSYPSNGKTMSFKQFRSVSRSREKGFPKVLLSQSDFAEGTVRLRYPAHYVLSEDIVFDPNPNDNWMPTKAQTTGSNAPYPVAPYGGYHLGFFAAITVEGENIFLDLNGKTIRQSLVFSVQQRFYANIELASTPFIPSQGPANFGNYISSAKNCLIANGTLGASSHHGIHGNSMKNVIMQNLIIEQFEVAGIALNGGEFCLVRNVQICNMSNDISVLSTYSSARFMEPVISEIVKGNPGATLEFADGAKTGQQILDDLRDEMQKVLVATQQQKEIPDGIFKNKTGLYDGGGYGIVLNSRGIVVNGFKKNREGAVGNENNVVHDVCIENCETGQGEIVGISVPANVSKPGAYGKKVQVGMVGDVFQIDVVTENQKYVGNVLSDAKLFLAKFGVGSQRGTVNIADSIIDWALSREANLHQVLKDNDLYFVSGGDSMAHVMKGFIGVFISAGKNIYVGETKVKNLANQANAGVVNVEATEDTPEVRPLEVTYDGAATRGFAVTGTETVVLRNCKISKLYSHCGISHGIDFLNTNSNVRCTENVRIRNVRSCNVSDQAAAPNPQNAKAVFVGISSDTSGLI